VHARGLGCETWGKWAGHECRSRACASHGMCSCMVDLVRVQSTACFAGGAAAGAGHTHNHQLLQPLHSHCFSGGAKGCRGRHCSQQRISNKGCQGTGTQARRSCICSSAAAGAAGAAAGAAGKAWRNLSRRGVLWHHHCVAVGC